MGKIIDLTGKRFHRLKVIEYIGTDKRNEAIWKCECECGKIINVRSYPLKSGHTKSCGCWKIDEARENPHKSTHGMSNDRLYIIWCNMKARCYNKNNPKYDDYGGRGITVCKEWLDDFMNFYNWAMENGYSKELEIDRKDNNGNYEPSNCRWTNRITQMNNTRNNMLLSFMGETKTIHQWAEEYKIEFSCLRWRIDNGWSVEKALKTPSKRRYIEYKGEIKTIQEWAIEYGLKYSCLQYRIDNGWDIEKAITTTSRVRKKK